VVQSGDVEWLTVSDVDWECLRLVYSSKLGALEPCILQTAIHCDSQFVVDTFWDVEPVQFLMQEVVELVCASDQTRCSVQYTLQLVSTNVSSITYAVGVGLHTRDELCIVQY